MNKSLKLKVDAIVKYSSLFVGNSSSTEERNIDDFNIDLPEEHIILEAMHDKRIILLTGEAGDGKSRMLKNVRAKSYQDNPPFEYIDDFSALSQDQKEYVIKQLTNILNGESEKRYLIAANIGIFVKYALREESELKLEAIRESSICKIINFENRNLANNSKLFQTIVKKFYGDEEPKCDVQNCSLWETCQFKQNLLELKKESVIENIRILCNAVHLMGKHITFRELLSFLASLATGGCDCELIQECPERDIRYYNIFEKTDGVILNKIMRLDPAKVTAEDDKDFLLFEACKNDLDKFKAEKRRRFFVLEDENKYQKLSIKYLGEFLDILRLMNQPPYYFDVTEENDSLLKIKEGLVRLISPEKTVWEISLFDMPVPINERIKTKFSIDFDQITLVWNHPDWKLNPEQTVVDHDDIFYFNLSAVYQDVNNKLQCYSLRIDYTLFQYIYKAKENYFFPSSSNVFHEYGLFDFFKKILSINPKFSEKVEILFEPGPNNMDFEMSFYSPNQVLKGKNDKKVKIRKMKGGN